MKWAILTGAFLAAAAVGTTPAPSAEATVICTNAGNEYKVGDYACLPGCHGRQRYARCDVIAETASWTFISEICPMAFRLSPAEGDNNPVPVQSAMSPIMLSNALVEVSGGRLAKTCERPSG